MKKLFFILTLILISAEFFGQTIERQTIMDTTRTDGQRFIVTMPYLCKVMIVDSSRIENDSVIYEPDYISTVQSAALYKVRKIRIVGEDTLIREHNVRVPLNEVGNSANNFLTGAGVRKAVRKEARQWVRKGLNEEY